MKRLGMVLLALTMVVFCSGAALAQGPDDIQKHPSCKYCGMDRQKFNHSRMLIEYDDGTAVGTCSLHCSTMDLALNIDKMPQAIMVGDYNTKKLIDTEKAFWVIGGSKMGVMTKRAKWAFAGKEQADQFIKENGGEPATFDQALTAAYEDLNQDTRMIREKRKMKKHSGH